MFLLGIYGNGLVVQYDEYVCVRGATQLQYIRSFSTYQIDFQSFLAKVTSKTSDVRYSSDSKLIKPPMRKKNLKNCLF